VAEDDVEGWGEFALDVSVVVDVEPFEEGLVEEASQGVGCGLVGGLGIGGELQGALEVAVDDDLVAFGGSESVVDERELVADAALFGLEEVEGNRVVVVGV
jgi:hypothetical protein